MVLAGVTFVRNGLTFDYCFEESIKSLCEFCDMVVVLDAGSDDGTAEIIKSYQGGKVHTILLPKEAWFEHQGKEKLSVFTNMAIDYLKNFDVDWMFYLQADEIVHEDSYQSIREVIEIENQEGYLVNRYNLWKDCGHMLNVPQERKPCSTEVIRLTRPQYRAVGDAENIACPVQMCITSIEIFHMGFVRDKKIQPDKIRHMQAEVFGMTPDAKLNGMKEFDWSKWFSDEDLVSIPKELPAIIKSWAYERS